MASGPRQVRFAEDLTSIYLLEESSRRKVDDCMCLEPRLRRNIWKQLHVDAQSMKQRGYGILLRDSFAGSDEISTQQSLNAFGCLGHGRGIERYISQKHDEDRRCAMDKAIRAVLGLQMVLRGNETPSRQVWERLSHTLQVHAESAKTFARRVGNADAVAATEDSKKQVDAFCLMKQMHQSNARRSVRRPSIGDLFSDLDDDISEEESDEESILTTSQFLRVRTNDQCQDNKSQQRLIQEEKPASTPRVARTA